MGRRHRGAAPDPGPPCTVQWRGAPPPPDAEEWSRAVAGLGLTVLVLQREGRHWRVARAECPSETRPGTSMVVSGTATIALRRAGLDV